MNILNWILSLFKSIPHNSFPIINTGLLTGQRDTDFVGGTLPFEVRNASADWRSWIPSVDEIQYSSNSDFMDCVSFSLTNSLEIQARKIANLNYNWSDRFLGKLSGTTKQGNYQYKVADAVRKYGLVNEERWPMPANATWESYYSDIPQAVIDQGKQDFPFTIAYEWVPTDKLSLLYHLKHAPIQITIPGQNPNHAVCLVAIVGDLFYYYDSYSPFLKTMSTPPASALKVVLYDNRIVLRQVGWTDTEEGLYFAFDSLDTKKQVLDAISSTFPRYRLEEKKWNLGKRPWQ